MEPEEAEQEEMAPISNESRTVDEIDSDVEMPQSTIQGIVSGRGATSTSVQPPTPATASPLMSHIVPSNFLTEELTSTRAGSGGNARKAPRLPPRKPVAKKKKKAESDKRKATTGVRRGNGFTQNETESLLELLEEHLPLGKEEWEKVARLHQLRYPQQHRNTDSLRRKFSSLCRAVPPTGDPSIPPDVLKAKDIRREMTERADIGYGEDSDDDYTTEMNDTAPFPPPATPATSGSAASVIPSSSNELTAEQSGSQLGPATSRNVNPSPRPLGRKRAAKPADDDDSILATLKTSLLQEQMRREEEHRLRMLEKEEEKSRREEERQIREQERLEDREQRAEERQRSDRMMQMMFVAMIGPRANSIFTDINDTNKD